MPQPSSATAEPADSPTPQAPQAPQEKLVVRNLFKIFGDQPKVAQDMLAKGASKQEIFEKTGQTIGVMDASFTVYAGEIFVIMGLSGSGKSTLVRLLNRLIEPTSGEILVDGHDIAKLTTQELRELRRQDMAMVFQSFALMPHMTVIDNAAFGLELAGLAKPERHKRALQALEAVGLNAWADSYPNNLSGGMQQRVGLARALANDPSIMLMDEAFSALDPLIRCEMQDELIRLQADSQRTIIFISHDLDEAMRIGDRIAIMEGGRIVQIGTPDEILRNPADDYVESFFRGVDVAKVLTAADVCRRSQLEVLDRADTGVRAAAERVRKHDYDFAVVVDRRRKFHGAVSASSLARALKDPEPTFHKAMLTDVTTVKADTPIAEVLGLVAEAPFPVPVIDDEGRYLGAISRSVLLQTLDRETPLPESTGSASAAAAAPQEAL
jgi:glycine betaine/proline transport system ATP-binding protein